MYYIQTEGNKMIGDITIISVSKNCYQLNSRIIENTVKSGSQLESFITSKLGDGGKDWVKKDLNIPYEAKKEDWVCFELSEAKDEIDKKIEKMYSTPTTQDKRGANWEIAKNTNAHKAFLHWAENN